VPEGDLTPDTESRGWPDPDPAEVAVRRADISAWHFGDVGVLTVAGLAYHFQAQGRGPLVGARTPGAADHVTPIVLTAHVRANLPRAYVVDAVTGANWEQAGVRPDHPCAEGEALERALALYAQSA
jgi:hypothetical protein